MDSPGTTMSAKEKSASFSSALPYSLALSIVFLVILCLSYSTNAADRQIFPTLLPAIRKVFGYDLKVGGLLATIFTLGLAVAGIPTGYLLNRRSRKSVILVGMLIYSIFTMATIYAHGFWDMLIYRAMTGIGEGMQMAGLFAAVGSYFHRRRSFFIGFMILAYGVGGFLGPRIGTHLMLASASWRSPFIWFAAAGVVLALIVLLCVPKGFSESKGPGTTAAVDQAAVAYMPSGLWNRNVIMGFVGSVVTGISLYGFIGLYTTYLKDVLKYSQMDAANAFSYFGLGGMLSFVAGWFGDRFPQRWVIAVAFAGIAAIDYIMYNQATSINAQCALTFLTGTCASGFLFVNLLALLQRSVRPQLVGHASGIFISSLFGAASTAGYLMGALAVRFGWGKAAFIELTLFPIIGIIAMVLVNPKQLIAVRAK